MISIYNLKQSEQWDALVRSFSKFDTYWLSGYVKAFQIHGDGEPLLIYYSSKHDSVRGINVVMKRDIARDTRFFNIVKPDRLFDFSTPYGYGGWIIDNLDNASLRQLFIDYERWCVANNIVSEFVRFHPVIKNHIGCENYYDVLRLGEVVAVDLTSPEVIWNNFSSKNRNMIRKAKKNGIKVYCSRCPEIYAVFKKIYDETMDKDNADDYYYFDDDFYKSVLDDLPENAQVFYAELDGIIIAASVMLAANRMMNYHLSGSLKKYSNLAPTNMIIYEASLWGCEHGYKSLYLGGGVGSGEDGLFKFKRSFYKGDLNRFYIGKKIFMEDEYRNLVDIRGEIESGFFPKYRA